MNGASELTVHRRDGAGTVVLIFGGELDISTLPRAERAVAAVQDAAPPTLVIDLSDLDFVDSSGVRLVLLADDRARRSGLRLAVRLGKGSTRRVFDVLGILGRIELAEDTG